MRHIYYYIPFVFYFRSGMTLQETRNFKHLGKYGYKTFLYGTYSDEEAYREVCEYIQDGSFGLTVKRGPRYWHYGLELVYVRQIMRDRSGGKIVIGRHLGMMQRILRLRRMLGSHLLIYELHERAFPHLLEKESKKSGQQKAQFQRLLDQVDGLVLTNYSQEILLKQEFSHLPPYITLPHAVEWDTYHKAAGSHVLTPDFLEKGQPIIVTFMGRFPAWRDIEMLFKAISLLDERFVLRIAGGISGSTSDGASAEYLAGLTDKYQLEGRVDYRGHVSPSQVVPKVLSGSAVLVLPLGDNLSARYLTCPIKLFEYMASQVPVVAVDFPSVNLITGQDTVFLSGNNAESFAQMIETAVYSPDLAERIPRMNALAKQYSFEERSKRVDAWFSQLLAT